MAIKQLSDGNPDGTSMGQSPTDDKISFFGATPVVQNVLGTGSTAAQIATELARLGLTRLT